MESFKMYFITTLWFLIVFYGTLVSVVAIFAISTLTNFYPWAHLRDERALHTCLQDALLRDEILPPARMSHAVGRPTQHKSNKVVPNIQQCSQTYVTTSENHIKQE